MRRYLNINLVWAIPATIAVTVFWFVSAVANYNFGISLGSPIFGYASLASDVLKAVALFGVFAALSAGYRLVASVLVVIWLSCTIWSVGSAVGFMSLHYATMTDERGKSAEDYKMLREEIERLEEKRGQVAKARPEGTVQAELDGLLRTPGVDGCGRINGPVTTAICPKIDALRAELSNSKAAMWIDGRLEEKRKEMKGSSRVTTVDPRADTFSAISGFPPKTVTLAIIGFFGLMLELITALAFWAFWRAFGGHVAKKPIEPSPVAIDPIALSIHHPALKAAGELPTRSKPEAKISGVAERAPMPEPAPMPPYEYQKQDLSTRSLTYDQFPDVTQKVEPPFPLPIKPETKGGNIDLAPDNVAKLSDFRKGPEDNEPPTKPRGKKKSLTAKDSKATAWLNSFVVATGGNTKLTSRQIFKAYEAATPEADRVSQKKLTILFTAEVAEGPRVPGTRADRDGAGSVFHGFEILSAGAVKRKAAG